MNWNVCGILPIQSVLKQWDILLALEYVIRNIQENKEGLKLNGAYQLLIYTKCTNLES